MFTIYLKITCLRSDCHASIDQKVRKLQSWETLATIIFTSPSSYTLRNLTSFMNLFLNIEVNIPERAPEL